MKIMNEVRQRRSHSLLTSYLMFIFLALVGYGVMNVRHTSGSSWALGDWLINYEGGFVRRGLTGEIILLSGRMIHASPVTLVLLLQLGCYGAVFVTVWYFLAGSRWPLWLIALVISPATLAFPIVDSQAGFRKEIIYFMVLAGLLLLSSRPWQRAWIITLYLSCGVAVSGLSHEGLLCFLPYYLAGIAIGSKDNRGAVKSFIAPAVVGIVVGCIVSKHPGDAIIASRICGSVLESLRSQGSDICSGAIRALGDDSQTARVKVWLVDVSYPVFSLYAVLGVVALVPIIIGLVDLWRDLGCRRNIRFVIAAFSLSLPASLVLFIYAEDWGRWIYIHIFSLSLFLFFLEFQRSTSTESVRLEAGIPRHPLVTLVVGTLLGIYATTWNLPHVPTYKFHSGYFGLYRHFREFKAK